MAGLSSKEAEKRKLEGLSNAMLEENNRSTKDILRSHILTYFNFVNLVLFLIVLTTGQFKNGLFIMTVVSNIAIGIFQELKAKKILDRLSFLVEEKVEVLRDDTWTKIAASQLVLGDRVHLKSGQQIPADGTVVDGYLEVNESALTGESKMVAKKAGDILLAGTDITGGEADADIIHVGKDNFSETIMKDARKFKLAKSAIKEDMGKFLHVISVLIIPIGISLFLVQKNVIGLSHNKAILKTVSAIIGMIPEGLVVLTSVALAVGAIRLGKKNVLVQDQYSIEALARVDVICVDKTGTLTKGTLEVADVIPLSGMSLSQIETIMGSYLNVLSSANITDEALIKRFDKNDRYDLHDLIPFSSDRKYSAVSFEDEGTFFLGAPNILFPCGNQEFDKLQNEATQKGRRTIVLAHSEQTEETNCNLSQLEPLALITLCDTLRENVRDIVRFFTEQGVSFRVLSGDDAVTVSSIAMQAGIPRAEHYADMTQNRYRDPEGLVKSCTVFGRVRPEQKKAMVQALQKQGHTVAMIGDGVNDVPALKTVDVGIAMASGSDAAKNSANIVLLDSDFGKLPEIIKEGRRVINNINRSSAIYLVKTCFSILLSIYVLALQKDYPFIPIQLSLVSMFCVGIPTMLLQFEPSFERISGRFFTKAFRNAVPSSIVIVLMVQFVDLLQYLFHISDSRYHGLLILLTAFTYFYTLYKVYYPPSTYRKAVIGTMIVLMTGGLIVLDQFVEARIVLKDLLFLIPCIMLIPVLIGTFSKVYNEGAKVCSKLLRKNRKKV